MRVAGDGRTGGREPEKLDAVLRHVVASTRLRDVFRNREIFSKWPELVDDSIAESTRVMGLKRGRLTVACRSQSLAAELAAFRKVELLQVLREGLGLDLIEDIRFVVEDDVD